MSYRHRLRAATVANRARRSSAEVAAEHQCGRAVFIITVPAADFVKSGSSIKPASRRIALTDFQIDRADAEAGETPQVQVEQLSGQAAASPCRRNRDGEDFRFAGGETRHDEPDQFAARG